MRFIANSFPLHRLSSIDDIKELVNIQFVMKGGEVLKNLIKK